MPDDLFSNAAEKDMFYSCSPVRTHNNKIYLFLPCELEYFIMFPMFPTSSGNDVKFNPSLDFFIRRAL